MRDQSGANNPNWRGGTSTNYYRYKLLQKERYPDRVAARNAVYYAVKSGRLERQPCEICGAPAEADHYMGYDREHWLTVRWRCRQHHPGRFRTRNYFVIQTASTFAQVETE